MDTKNDIETEFDPTLPPRNQLVGAMKGDTEYLKTHPEKWDKLNPIFTMAKVMKPKNVYWRSPKAVLNFDNIERNMIPILPNGKIKKLVCKEGTGEMVISGNNVLINYYAYIEGNPVCAESNKRWGKPHKFVLGARSNGVSVLDFGTLTMRVKEVSAFLADPEYAYIYGKMGMNLRIPQTKKVLYIIELLNKLPSPSDSSSIINMVAAERKLLSFDEIYGFAMEKKLDANKDLAENKGVRALRKYFQAVTCLMDATTRNAEHENRKYQLLHTLYGNIAVASFQTDQIKIAIEFSQKAIALPISEEAKSLDYFRCAKGLCYESKWEEAKYFIDKAALHISNDMPEFLNLQDYIHTALEKMHKVSDSKSLSSNFSGFFRRYSTKHLQRSNSE